MIPAAVEGDSDDAPGRAALGTDHDSLGDQLAEAARKQGLERGRTIGRYVVLYELGSGGMGVVYAAYDPELDRKIALKLLHGDTASPRGRQRLMREAKAIAKLSHTNVVTVHDVGTYEGRVFVAMEFIDGVTLRQWLRERPRAWNEVLDVLVAAGAGLAAAHAADLIHRDFKPDNVLVDRTGRVVVLDFGLARRAQSRDDDPVSRSGAHRIRNPSQTGSTDDLALEERLEQLASRSSDLDVELTRTGALLGTPAYMAPEQHLGNPVDARSDQFSFCVVLWESVYGLRPFRGDSARTTAVSVVKGALQEPPKGNGVPSWLRRVLGRGLAVDGADRYPDMHALLAALRREATRKVRRRLGVGIGIAGVGLGATVAYLAATREPSACDGGPERMAGVWDDSVRAQVRDMFMRTELTYAATAFTGVELSLDGYATRWLEQHRDACRATHVHHEQSEELLDLRMTCLRARLGELSALTDEFRHADAQVVQHAVEAAAELGRLEPCADARALAARVMPPADAKMQNTVEQLRTRLADARAKEAAGRYDASLAVAQSVVDEAAALGYTPIVAEARLRLGSALERTGDFARAEQEYLESIWHAEAARHEVVAADAWVRLVWVTGVERGDTAAGEMWARFAEAAVQRVGTDELLRAELTHNRAGVLYRQRRLDEAFELYREALEVQQRLLGPDDPLVAMSFNHMGNVKIEQGDLTTAAEYVTRSYELRKRVLGERHPKVAASINNLGAIALKQTQPQKALDYAEQALAIVGGSGGAEEMVGLTVAANAAIELGPPSRATEYLERLLELREQASPPTPEAVAEVRTWLAANATAMGKYDAAAKHLDAAIMLQVASDPKAAARTLIELARVHTVAKHPSEASAALVRAMDLAQTATPRDAALVEAITAAQGK
jgi:tetratricopeptide (TPR) repeat protein/predicted Ser/Thr protein kinase